MISKHHSIRLLYAPLAVNGQITPLGPLVFNGLTFLAGQPTDVRYQFNNYRLSYIYQFDPVGKFVFRLGATEFLRDAEVRLRNKAAGLESAFSNVGFVPLVYFGTRYNISERLFGDFEMDGSAAPGGQGRAFDLAFSVGYKLTPKWTVSGGYRFIEGGANVPSTYNFAFLSHFFGRLAYSF